MEKVNKIKKVSVRKEELWATMESGLKLKVLNFPLPAPYPPEELIGKTLEQAFEYHKTHKRQ